MKNLMKLIGYRILEIVRVVFFSVLIGYFIFIIVILLSTIFSCSAKKENDKSVVIKEPVYIKHEIKNIPERPVLDEVKWIKINEYYCVDKNNAKILLKNLYKLDNYARELEIIIKQHSK